MSSSLERGIDTVVVPLAGIGTRMWPFTAGEPKFMAGVSAGSDFKPNIDFTLDDLVAADIKHAVFVVSGNGGEVLRNYLGPMPKHLVEQARALGKEAYLEKEAARRDALNDMTIEFIEQGVGIYGTAVPLNLARTALQGVEHFAMAGGDDFIWHPDGKSEFAQQIENWRGSRAGNSLMGKPVPREDAPKYGIIDQDEQANLVRIVEKPPIEQVPSHPLANISRYLLSSAIWPYLDEVLAQPPTVEKPEYYITDVINMAVEDGQGFNVHPVEGHYFDAGSPQGILQAGQFISAHLLKG